MAGLELAAIKQKKYPDLSISRLSGKHICY